MKRIHLFELEDQNWFPDRLRVYMTRLIVVMHRLLNSSDEIAGLLSKIPASLKQGKIVDLCSGSGGPMPEVCKILEKKYNYSNLKLTLTDRYPNQHLAAQINEDKSNNANYITRPIDATNVPPELKGIRTMVSSFHHFRPEQARKILSDAMENNQPILIYEISDNSAPLALAWISLPVNFLMTFFITPFVRPLTLPQIIFTYLIPVLPLCFAWDGAVSNVRTYTTEDMNELLMGLENNNYTWEKGLIGGKLKKIYLMGTPN